MAFIFLPPGSTFSDLSAARVRGFPFDSVATIARNETAYQISDRPVSVASLQQVSAIYKKVLAVPFANAPGVMTGARVLSISDQAAIAAAARDSVLYLMDDDPVILSAAGVTSFGASAPLPPGNVAPTITTQPSISGNATTGSVLTLNAGAASGTPAPTSTIQWLRGSTVISGATGATYTLVSGDVGQAISAQVTWTNSAGSVSATSNAIIGQAPAPVGEVDPQNYNILVDLDTPRTLNGSEVGEIQTEGKDAYIWPLSLGTTAAPIQDEDGSIIYSDGRFHHRAGLSVETGDGIILVADFTPTALAGTQTILTAGNIIIRATGTIAQVWYSNSLTGTAKNISAGTLVNGQRTTMAVHIDRAGNFISWLNTTNGQIEGEAIELTADLPNVTTLSSGNKFIGSIHNRAIIFQKKGEPLSRTFAQVTSDFQQGA